MEQNNPMQKLRMITIGAIIILVILFVSFLRVFFKDYELRREIERVQTDVSKLEKRKIESLDVLQKLQSDTYAEERARDDLQAAKPGEIVLVVPGLTVTSSAQSARQVELPVVKELSNPAKWWYYFFRSNN